MPSDIIQRGSAFVAGKIKREGAVWGEDILLGRPSLQQQIPAIPLTYLWVYCITSAQLFDIIERYPSSKKILMERRLWWLRRRILIVNAQKERETQKRTEFLHEMSVYKRNTHGAAATYGLKARAVAMNTIQNDRQNTDCASLQEESQGELPSRRLIL